MGNSEADRQLLEAAKAGDVETVKVRYGLMFLLTLGFYFQCLMNLYYFNEEPSYLYVPYF